MNHPTAGDTPQGTDITFPEHRPGCIEILVWRGYSEFTGRYYATYAAFQIEEGLKTIRLFQVRIKEPFKEWVVKRKDRRLFISDHMERAVRKAVAELTGLSYWRIT